MPRYTIQNIRAPNDRNGNPCRLHLVCDLRDLTAVAYDDGYVGPRAVPRHMREDGESLPPINVSASEYRRLLKAYAPEEVR